MNFSSLHIRKWPLRTRLVAITVLFTAVTIALSDFVATTAVGSYLVTQIDQENTSIAASTVSRLDRFGIDPNAELEGGLSSSARPLGRVPTATIINVVDDQGALIAQIGGEEKTARPSASDMENFALNKVLESNGKPFSIKEKSGEVFRAVALPFTSGFGSVIVSTPLDNVADTTHKLIILLALISLLILLIVGFISYYVLKINFRPLNKIEVTAQAIADGDLSARLETDETKTEVGSLKNSLNKMLIRIEAAFRSKSESEERLRRFVADASHELRTPITAIRGYSELVRQGAVSGVENVKEVFNKIENESVRMGNLVEDLLTLARLDENPILDSDPVDLKPLVKEAVEAAQVSSLNHNFQLNLPEDDFYVIGDSRRIYQCITNLITNARTHTPDGTKIEVKLNSLESENLVEVIDNGPGLTLEDKQRIFERFYRADLARSRKSGEGSGLGLSIVSALMEAMGGKVTVESEYGAGAKFTLHFPLDQH